MVFGHQLEQEIKSWTRPQSVKEGEDRRKCVQEKGTLWKRSYAGEAGHTKQSTSPR